MFREQVKTHFDAAHYLRDYEGKCSREHGHRWEVEVCIQGEELDDKNMLVDFGIVKKYVDDIVDRFLDHHQINETLSEPNPTAEFLAQWLYNKLQNMHEPSGKWELVRVTVWESPNCCVKYSPAMRSTNERPVRTFTKPFRSEGPTIELPNHVLREGVEAGRLPSP